MNTTLLIILLLFTSFVVIGVCITSLYNKQFNSNINTKNKKVNDKNDISSQSNNSRLANKNNGWPDDYVDYSGGMLGL